MQLYNAGDNKAKSRAAESLALLNNSEGLNLQFVSFLHINFFHKLRNRRVYKVNC